MKDKTFQKVAYADYLIDLKQNLANGKGLVIANKKQLKILFGWLDSNLYTTLQSSPFEVEFQFEISSSKEVLFESFVSAKFLFIRDVSDLSYRSNLILYNIIIERIKRKNPTFLDVTHVKIADYSSIRLLQEHIEIEAV